MKRINVLAIVAGVVALPIIYAPLTALFQVLVGHPGESSATWLLVAPVAAAILWLGPGFVTGYVAKQSPALHGLVLGGVFIVVALAALALLPMTSWQLVPEETPYVVGFTIPIALGALIGAFIGTFVARRRRRG